ncbi:WS/DGAT/MGAT family O-acyltransferase [Egicoccus halophilus]|uniref:Diacylglycerol O-acyltransferase n=1 Tax=Egicoccus halophilus TaxID=1670830 RepID=A0A8J3ETG3_9ACTN|nr:wax ester/triacylglycerol synthase family O-acyltransferase [Egicoccus halophilus]GGI05564.1 diacylglycerol O-acyltransferase [Egicoccus halophilus]
MDERAGELRDRDGRDRSGRDADGREHGERLSALDAVFLSMEAPDRHMHGGSLMVFDRPTGPDGPEDFDHTRFLRLVRARLSLVPRYRQKLAAPPLPVGNPVWVDDEHFDLSYHVRHAALPRPGSIQQLSEYCARILSRPLDRDRPLWELYVIEGLEDGRFAVLNKTHHAMVDGRSGIDLTSVLLDTEPDVAPQLPSPSPWSPAPTPGAGQLLRDAARDALRNPAALVTAGGRLVAAPTTTLRRAMSLGRVAASMTRATLVHGAPRSLLNQPPGPHRRFAIQRIALEEAKRVKDTFGTTVNDVVLAAVADATGRYLRGHGAVTDRLWLRAMVPVSTRAGSEQHALGNRVVSVFVDLPVFEQDPIERLRICHEAMAGVRSTHHAVGADFLIGLGEFAPPTLHAMAARAAVHSRLFNFLVTNVPGPQQPVYCLGARLIGSFPFTPLTATQSYAVGLTSTDGWLNFGFTADYDTLPDIERVTGYLRDAFDDLCRCADAVTATARDR